MNRKTNFHRKTNETDIRGQLNLAGKGVSEVQTGIGFLDHMLDLWAFHSGFDLTLSCQGDLHVCAHHSIEDIAIVLGNSFFEALGDRKGIARYATVFLPMDETLTRTVIDISGRPCHIFHGDFGTEEIGSFPVEMTQHFFNSFATSAKLTLHQEIVYGSNDHHRVESLFKGFGKALAQAITVTTDKIPSSKGVL
ncbi:MAG: imidazoleglycerol-phosphate dehydratase HisB [Deltaproteobacteria bacterium]|jgi:imidazoleglycerol phosphate dehydratase HisB|nr:imidazoleglycerol-phosphate dehydratase HisB [Deltaproteobacteria bacterium]MBT4266284.1 imidazoleglycerol-phosphate dehydratase HisB [Deltaproteobacteria bacterium]MBT4639994.1 imidazoleglycerol-phosphate dehydratase HisB [Deltaproteobacteria bacterium]MBT6503826.1 imidazoleglycerol-phosphate dehydratase HisB [Deltaproteobacteria bacterium]MBT6615830.1 imidazoleglycerol-phosphate dehydratase HisB [Deltaproteobacteria bacterium]